MKVPKSNLTVDLYIERFRKAMRRPSAVKAIEKLRVSMRKSDLLVAERKLAQMHRQYVVLVRQALEATFKVFLPAGSSLVVRRMDDYTTELRIEYSNGMHMQIAMRVHYDFDIAIALEDDLGNLLLRPLDVVDLFNKFVDDSGISIDSDLNNLPLVIAYLVSLVRDLKDYDAVANLTNLSDPINIEAAYSQYVASYGVPEDFGDTNTELLERLIGDFDVLLGADDPANLSYLDKLSDVVGEYIGADSEELVDASLYRGCGIDHLMNSGVDLHTPSVHDWAQTVICMIQDLQKLMSKFN